MTSAGTWRNMNSKQLWCNSKWLKKSYSNKSLRPQVLLGTTPISTKVIPQATYIMLLKVQTILFKMLSITTSNSSSSSSMRNSSVWGRKTRNSDPNQAISSLICTTKRLKSATCNPNSRVNSKICAHSWKVVKVSSSWSSNASIRNWLKITHCLCERSRHCEGS